MAKITSDRQFMVVAMGRYYLAVPVTSIERVVSLVEVVPFIDTPAATASGVISFQGKGVTVHNLRPRFVLDEVPMRPSDPIIIARTSEGLVGIVADRVFDIISVAEQQFATGKDIVPGLRYIRGVPSYEGGIFVIQDPGQFLSSSEKIRLDDAMEA